MRQINESEVVEFLSDLVRIPSVNPPGNERPVADLIVEKLRATGLQTRLIEAERKRPNVVAHVHGTTGGTSLLLNGHMDTFPAGPGWKVDPFGAKIVDGKLYGRGALDMKGGLAAMIMSVLAICRSEVGLDGDLIVMAVADEIAGGYKGTGYLVQQKAVTADMGVVCEPTGPDVYVAHRGALWIELTTVGRSAHGGRPWLGVNAISKMAKVIAVIERELPLKLSKKKHWILPSPTFNIGLIQGGDMVNMVPGKCRVEIDRRMIPGETSEEATKEIVSILDKLKKEDDELQFFIRKTMELEAGEIRPTERIVLECKKAYQDITGEEPGIGCTAGFEDAHFLIHGANIPTAMFGPYSKAPARDQRFETVSGTPEEHVEISELIKATKVYAKLILNILR